MESKPFNDVLNWQLVPNNQQNKEVSLEKQCHQFIHTLLNIVDKNQQDQ